MEGAGGNDDCLSVEDAATLEPVSISLSWVELI